MRRYRITTALLALGLAASACGHDDVPIQRGGLQPASQSAEMVASAPTSAPNTMDAPSQPAPSTTATTTEPEPTITPTTEPTPTPVAVPRPARTVPTLPPATVPAVAVEGGGLACGGSLPPCWVMRRESNSAAYPGGGDPRIWNGGCYDGPCGRGASWASGKWQFMPGTWGGYGGYANAADAPVGLQDARAQQVWASGAGCSHWGAC